MEERLEFIDSLVLPKLSTRSPILTFAAPDVLPKVPHNPNNATASVAPDTINTFFPGVSESIIADVNLCKLVMQNAATKKYPGDSQLFEWYKYYIDGLSKLGWVIQNRNLQEVTIRRTGLTMDEIALEITKGLIGDKALLLANIAKAAVEAVQNNPKAIQIFDLNKKLGQQAKFDVAPVWVDDSGQPNMILNCISLDARESTRGILFWKSTSKSTAIKSGATRTYLDNRIFTGIRGALNQKFSDNAKKYIEDLPDF
jgi:hypothetical protein